MPRWEVYGSTSIKTGLNSSVVTDGAEGYGRYDTHDVTTLMLLKRKVTVTRSRDDYTGFDDVAICRPRFIFFKVTGLRPNTRHFVFFDTVNVTDYVNVDSFTYAQRLTLSRNSLLRNPGDAYVNETEFPTAQGGKSSVIRSDDAGEIEGCFYLQSNATLNFPTGTRKLVFLDISSYKPAEAISYATASFTADGGVENYLRTYYTTTKTVRKTEKAESTVTEFTAMEKPVPPSVTTSTTSISSSRDDDGPTVSIDKQGNVSFTYDYGTVTHLTNGGVTKNYLGIGP